MRAAALLLAVLWAVSAQAQTSAEASVDRTTVEVGDEVRYTLRLRGGRGLGLQPPTASKGLRLLSARPVLDATTTVNGQTERTLSWLYEATAEGRARIDRMRLRLGAQTLTAASVAIDVVSAASAAPGVPPLSGAPPGAPAAGVAPRGDLFVRAEASRQSAFVGEQVVVDYVLYFRPELQPRQTNPTGAWDAPGFWREELDVPPTYPRPVTLGGQRYEAVTIRRLALFPTRAGALRLAPMTFDVDLLRASRSSSTDPFAPFFSPFSSRYESETVEAPALAIAAKELPGGAPPSFGGAVGTFGIATTVGPRAVAAGDPVRVEVTLSGTGNVAAIEAPALATPPSVDAYAPRAERTTDTAREPLRGRVTFRYTLVPQAGGDLEVPPAVWSYFDPADGRYKTLRSDPATVTVTGEAAPASDTPAPSAALLTEPGWQRAPLPTALLWALLGGGLGAPALAALLLAGARRGRERLAADTPERRARRAPAEVRRRLAAARAATGPRRADAVERAARAFLADRFGLPSELGRAEIGRRLAARTVAPEARAALDDVLARAERAQFAPGTADDALADDAERALAALAR